MSMPLKVIYRFNAVLIKIPMIFWAKIEKLIPEFIWNLKGPHVVKTILKKAKQNRKTHTSDFKTYYKATIIKTVWY